MSQMITLISDKINVIVSILSGIVVFIISIKTNFFSKDKILKDKYLHFKTIRKEYSENKINGYFALQQYFNVRLSTEEMDCILESSDAYTIFFLLKEARGKYEFKNKNFVSKITKKKYILPFIGYFISCFFLSVQLIYAKVLISMMPMYSFILLLIYNLGINVPILLVSLFSISEIACTFKLCKLTTKVEEKDQEVSSNK